LLVEGALSPTYRAAMQEAQDLIEEGLRHFGIPFDDHQLKSMVSYIGSLDRWNRRMNLVGLNATEAIIRRLLYDAFFLCTCIGSRQRILEIGSGAGVVAIPLAIVNRSLAVVSAEKSLKKVQFQRHARRMLHLVNLEILHGRIEDMAPLGADILLAKAFGSASDILRKGGGHLKEGGSALLVKGMSEKPLESEGFMLEEVRPYRLPKSPREYQLFVYKKVS
jgi:16S rRNA (guanine527-N7)-methyltransferase